jgi:hypothetical protein
LKEGGRDGSFWWRELVSIRGRAGFEAMNWFEDSLRCRIGNGVNSFFLDGQVVRRGAVAK